MTGQTETDVSVYITKVDKMVTISIPQLSPVFTATSALLSSYIVTVDGLKPAHLTASTFVSDTSAVGIIKWNYISNEHFLTFSTYSNWVVGGYIQPFSMLYESINNTPLTTGVQWGVAYSNNVPNAPFLSTPTLTFNTSASPNFVVTQSSIYASTYEGWRLFDGNQAGYWTSIPGTYLTASPFTATSLNSFNTGTSVINGAWVKITLNEQKQFNYYRLGQFNGVGSANALADFNIYGSNDNLSYAIIDQKVGYSTAGTTGIWNPNISIGNQQYQYIVFQVTKLAGYGSFVSVVNLEFGHA
jgi:hypothetical protein